MEDIIEKWHAFWFFLLLGTVTLTLGWKNRFFIPLIENPLPRISGADVIRGFALFIFIEILFIPSVLGIFYSFQGMDLGSALRANPQSKGWVNLCVMLGGFSAVFVSFAKLRAEQRTDLWRQTSTPWYENVIIGAVAWLISYPPVVAINEGISLAAWYLFNESSVEQAAVQHVRMVASNPILLGGSAITIVLLVPLTEEYLFRGLLQSWLKQKFSSPFLGIVLSSIVFAFFHFSTEYGISNIQLLSSLFLLSCMLGYLFERQRSLLASVALHSVFNFMSFLMVLHDYQAG